MDRACASSRRLVFSTAGPARARASRTNILQLAPLPLTEEISLPIAVLFPAKGDAGRVPHRSPPFAQTFVRLARTRGRPTDRRPLRLRHVPRHAGVVSPGRLLTTRFDARRAAPVPSADARRVMLLIAPLPGLVSLHRRQCPWLCWFFFRLRRGDIPGYLGDRPPQAPAKTWPFSPPAARGPAP